MSQPASIRWLALKFSQLSTDQLYELLKLRVDVFVVEQCCYYPELDELDRLAETVHLLAYQQDTLIGYLRVLPVAAVYQEYSSIGRVAIAATARGTGLGHQLIAIGIDLCHKHYAGALIKISAQAYLEKFYQQHQFVTTSEVYLEDNIPHVAMIWRPSH